MDRDILSTSSSHKSTYRSSGQYTSNKDYRLKSDKHENYPDGYLEDWDVTETSTKGKYSHESNNHRPNAKYSTSLSNKKVQSNTVKKQPKITPQNSKLISGFDLNADRSMIDFKSPTEDLKSIPLTTNSNSLGSRLAAVPDNDTKSSSMSLLRSKDVKFTPVSIILSTQENILLNTENNYEIRFSTGMLEGSGLSINETGNIITFIQEGSYRFEISGEAVLFSDVEVNLVYHSDKFTSDILPFSIAKIPKDDGKLQLRGIPTILPLQKGQTIVAKLIPTPDESIILMGGTRLLIHKVA